LDFDLISVKLGWRNITREEEKALKITEEATHAWREEHDIPDTGSLELMQAEA
jgi:hypothetical protein